jgi:uncharacterized protein (DUF488 family)
MIKVYTIGFTNKSAQSFFDLILKHEIQTMVDTRLNNRSQLAGFAKGQDLPFFLERICHCTYEHNLDFAPSRELLEAYRKKQITWTQYAERYNTLLRERAVEKRIKWHQLHQSCFLCSEHSPEKCHRRLLVEYLQAINPDIQIVHLK